MAINLNTYSSSSNRITGLYSGMDTQSLVNNMMALEQLKVDKIYQQREKALWKNEAYTTINTAVTSLRNSFLSVMGDKSVVKNSTYNAFKVNMAQNSAISITATSSATPTSFSITSIKAATAASATSDANSRGASMSSGVNSFAQASAVSTAKISGMTEESTIGDFASRFDLKSGENLSFSINGETFTFNQDTKISDMLSRVNASNAKVTLSLDDGKFTLKSNEIGGDTKLQLSDISGKTFGSAAQGLGFSSNNVQRKSAIDATTSIGDLKAMGFTFKDNSLSINGQSFTFDDTTKVYDLINDVNASNAGVTMTYNEQTSSFRVSSNDENGMKLSGSFFSDGVFKAGTLPSTYTESDPVRRSDTLASAADKMGTTIGDQLTVKINGKEFTFDTKNTTLSQMMSTINNSADAKVTFAFNEMTDTFSLSSLDTGKAGALSDISGLEVFGITQDNVKQGTDAVITLADGNKIIQSTNSFELDGMKFEILGDFAAESSKDNINVNVTRDYSTTIDAVKSFVEEYNKLIDQLNTLYTGKVYRDYAPLTETQRAELTDKEAEQWDEKAKSGILRNDPAVGSLLTSLRTALGVKVDGTGMSAYDLGITTVAWNSASWKTDQGKLQLDEDKLLAALEKNPNAVQDVFTKIGYDEKGNVDTSSNGAGVSTSGLFTRISEFMSTFNSKMRNQNIKQTQESVDSYSTKISDMLTKMAEKEERYWKQYTQMETMLSQMQAQQDWLSAQLGTSS